MHPIHITCHAIPVSPNTKDVIRHRRASDELTVDRGRRRGDCGGRYAEIAHGDEAEIANSGGAEVVDLGDSWTANGGDTDRARSNV